MGCTSVTDSQGRYLHLVHLCTTGYKLKAACDQQTLKDYEKSYNELESTSQLALCITLDTSLYPSEVL